MGINLDRLKYLLEQYSAKAATEGEIKEMFALIETANDTEDEDIKAWLQAELQATNPTTNYDHKRWNKVLANILSPVAPEHSDAGYKPEMPGKVRRMYWWKRTAAAACILLLAGFGWYYLTNKPENLKPTEVAQTHDVKPPTNNRATITLASGQVVYLDSVNNGTLARQGNVNLQKLGDGKIIYNSLEQAAGDMPYNTLSNPRGSKVIDMTLSDGSRVWLNAGSSVTYPVAFVGKERKVTMNGEAYFEVAHNPAMPFKVSKGEATVTVLGTHFNVNAYDDEEDIKVTLLEGSVQTSITGAEPTILKPGQQAQMTNTIRLVTDANLDEVMAWKNGRFQFEKASLQEVLRQLVRWYDVEVNYEGRIPDLYFGGKIQRDLSLKDMLDVLTKSQVHYRIDGNKLTITQ